MIKKDMMKEIKRGIKGNYEIKCKFESNEK